MTQDIDTQKFKHTPIGWIPKEWEVKKLVDCSLIKGEYGLNAPAVEYSPDLPTYIRITDIDEDGNFSELKKSSVNDNNALTYLLQKGDILFARTGATVGKTYLHNSNSRDLVFAGFLIRFRPREDILKAEYLKFYTSTKIYWDWVKTTSMRSGQPGINAEEFGSLRIPLPPLPEQRRIATLLGTWDRAIETTQKLIAQKELRKKWLMQMLLSGKKRLKGFEGEWKFIRFNEIYAPLKEKANDRKFMVLSVTKDGIVSQSEYFNKEVASEDTSPYLVVRKGNLVMSGLNFWMGAIDVLTQYNEGIVSPAYKAYEIKNEEIYSELMCFFARSEVMKKALLGSSVQGASIVRRNLDKETLDEWVFNIPSFEEQTAIATILQTADSELQLHKRRLEKLREQKKGLMQVLLTGKKTSESGFTELEND